MWARSRLKLQWDVYDRRGSFWLQLFSLKYLGLWPPEDADETTRKRYVTYGWLVRISFLYLYILSQALYFKDVKDINDIADSLYVLLTQIMLAYKLENFCLKIHRIQTCMRKLNCTLYHPKRREEHGPVLRSMHMALWLMIIPTSLAFTAMIMWSLSPVFDNERRLPIPAWFPVDYRSSYVAYGFLCLYQMSGIFISALYNFSSETLFTGMLLHVNAQVERLGIMVKKIGHETVPDELLLPVPFKQDDEWEMMRERIEHCSRMYGKTCAEVIECVLFHKDILNLSDEVQDIYKGPIFAQMCASVIIICMTLLRADSKNLLTDQIADGIYLVSMMLQVLMFSYVGNEITHSTGKLTELVGFSNYPTFDKNTSKVAMLFMQKTLKDVHINVGSVLQITLNLHTFLQIMKMSYSYLAVLQSMDKKE